MKVKSALMIALAACLTLTANAQKAREEIKKNIYLSGSNYLAYPGPKKQLTDAPKGYVPYYISHYGRHGSRYLIGTSDYDKVYNVLKKADDANALTEKGKETLEKVRQICDEARGRDGELTQRGAEQHKEIAKRMYERFPEVFAGKANVDAKSTVVIRCILSMENALQQLLVMNPELNITHDASNHDMYYMNQPDTMLDRLKHEGTRRKEVHEFNVAHSHPERLMKVLFCNEEYVKENVKAGSLMDGLFNLASNIQSTETRHKFSMYDLFTEDEVYDQWLKSNVYWYIAFGPSPYSQSKQPYSQRNLLRKIISEADSCLAMPHPGATLRYGHDTMVMPLTCLLNLNGYGDMLTEDLEQIDDMGWNNYDIFPMATNIQFIFYAPEKDINSGKAPAEKDILVKVLLSEDEATLPIKQEKANCYKWTDFKSYYLKKLDDYE